MTAPLAVRGIGVLELAQALVNAPRLVVLDEPTIGLDPMGRTSVWEHITEVRASTAMTVLVTTHYATLDDVFRVTTGDELAGDPGERMRDVRLAQGV